MDEGGGGCLSRKVWVRGSSCMLCGLLCHFVFFVFLGSARVYHNMSFLSVVVSCNDFLSNIGREVGRGIVRASRGKKIARNVRKSLTKSRIPVFSGLMVILSAT